MLDATVALLEDVDLPEVVDIADHTGLAAEDVARALKALDGVRRSADDHGRGCRWFVNDVTPEARRAVGQWPTGDSLVARLVEGLDAAAEREADPEGKSRLRQVVTLLGGPVRVTAVDVAEKVIERSMGLG